MTSLAKGVPKLESVAHAIGSAVDWNLESLVLVPFEDNSISTTHFRVEPMHCDGTLLTPRCPRLRSDAL